MYSSSTHIDYTFPYSAASRQNPVTNSASKTSSAMLYLISRSSRQQWVSCTFRWDENEQSNLRGEHETVYWGLQSCHLKDKIIIRIQFPAYSINLNRDWLYLTEKGNILIISVIEILYLSWYRCLLTFTNPGMYMSGDTVMKMKSTFLAARKYMLRK